MLTRRAVLGGIPLTAVGLAARGLPVAGAVAAPRPRRRDRVLVVVELVGGNDGVNTIVPFADDGYGRARVELRLRRDALLAIDDHVGMHPALRPFMDLLQDGRLAVAQGVGYPEPNLSHFRSRAIMHEARRDLDLHEGTGWLGRGLDSRAGAVPAAALFLGPGAPTLALRGQRANVSSLEDLRDFEMLATPVVGAAAGDGDLQELVRTSLRRAAQTSRQLAALAATATGAPASGYPTAPIGRRLELIAQLLRAGSDAAAFYTEHGDFDTHANQLEAHAARLGELATAVRAFLRDVATAGLDRDVTVLMFSEFGRAVQENGSAGTDHGTAGPMFVAGPQVHAGVFGTTPSMTELRGGHLAVHVDFRRVYADALGWLGLDLRPALPEGPFEPLGMLRAD